jgi:hypothetical protein
MVIVKKAKILHQLINNAAFTDNVYLIGTVLPIGFSQVTPRGSTMVFDDEHIALWERGRGSTSENLSDGCCKVRIFSGNPRYEARVSCR